jgi:hypothetical protein
MGTRPHIFFGTIQFALRKIIVVDEDIERGLFGLAALGEPGNVGDLQGDAVTAHSQMTVGSGASRT